MSNMDWLYRTEILLSKEGIISLKNASVIIFGLGGVGSFAAQALIRAGIGSLSFVDGDVVEQTNINRQLIATTKTIGEAKTEVMKRRALEINPEAQVKAINSYYTEETASDINLSGYDYVVDAVDTVDSKILLVERANECGTRIISAMGAGNKLDPTKFAVADIYDTSVCPLARVMRAKLRKRGISKLKVVYSTERFITQPFANGKVKEIGSVSFVPSVAGLIMAGEVVKDIVGLSE